ncbi:MAG TPA: hypothetical protein VLG91_04855, partial [Streptomyces sp.]|nr:hypothetical protein [Streptomyces sp.]
MSPRTNDSASQDGRQRPGEGAPEAEDDRRDHTGPAPASDVGSDLSPSDATASGPASEAEPDITASAPASDAEPRPASAGPGPGRRPAP